MKEYIEREAILQYAEKMYALAQKHVREGNTESDVWKATHETQMNERKEFVDLLQSVPAANVVEMRHGRWIWNAHHCKWECSECGGMEGECESPVCKWCGARMDKEDEYGTD